MLSLLLPLVSVEGGQRLPLLLLVLVVPLLAAFVLWERRIGRLGGDPLLDVALLRRTPGYGNGLAVGALYFTGFTGVFLVLSVFFQDELGYSPLTAGLLLTPFALGSALTAPLAGRLVSRIHRSITVIALAVMMLGVLAVALLVPGRDADGLWLFLVPPLLVAGPRRRRRGLAELHAQPGRGAAGDGRRGRRGAADRAADRLLDRRGPADDRLPAHAAAPRAPRAGPCSTHCSPPSPCSPSRWRWRSGRCGTRSGWRGRRNPRLTGDSPTCQRVATA